MYVVGSFRYDLTMEVAIAEIEEMGIEPSEILAIPLDKPKTDYRLFDSMNYADGESFLDLALAMGTVGMLLGSIYGFVLYLGPIVWAFIGLIGGSAIGFTIKFFMIRRKHRGELKRTRDKNGTEVVVMIRCSDVRAEAVEHVLWTHHALGVGILP